MIFPCAKYANAKIQIYKYTNAAYYELPETPNMCHILEKRIVQGYQKLYFHVSNMQTPNYKIQNTKYTNTTYNEVPERPSMWYIYEKRIDQEYYNLYSHVSNAQIQKYKYTNTQIHI